MLKKNKNKEFFGFEIPEDSPGFMLWKMTSAWQHCIRQTLKPYNISHIQHVVLAVLLWFEKSCVSPTQIDVVHMVNLDKMTVSKSVKKLVKDGYVKSYESKTDSRAKQMELTKKGRDLAVILIPLIEKTDEDFFGHLKGEERKVFIKTMYHLAEMKLS